MTRRATTGLLVQYAKNAGGAAADDYWIKFYSPNTTSELTIYTESEGGSSLSKCRLNSLGQPINNPLNDNATFIPYVDADYDAYLFSSEFDADNNNTTAAIFLGQNISAPAYELTAQAVQQFKDVESAVSGTAIDGTSVNYSALTQSGAIQPLIETTMHNTASKAGAAKYIIKTLTQAAADGDIVDGSGAPDYVGGNHALSDGIHCIIIQISNECNVLQFGAVADGTLDNATLNPSPTDNRRAFNAACNYLRRNVYAETQGGKVVFPQFPNQSYATSGDILLPEGQIEGFNTRIVPLGNPDYIFKLDLRHTTNARRFTKNFKFGGFICHSDRGFGVPTQSTDMGHLLLIDGGWLIRSKIYDLDCAPSFACKSLVHWDLTHPDIGEGVTEVGVPDSIDMHNISAQYAENTSYAISFSGDELGTLSRASSIDFRNIYNSIRTGYSFVDRSTTTEDFGGIRLDNVKIGRSTINEIFSRNAVHQFNSSSISSTEFVRLYNEYNYQTSPTFECVLRGGSYNDCVFRDVSLYSENNNLTNSPRLFDSTFTNCDFHVIWFNFTSKLTSPPTANSLNLGVNSSGCRFHKRPSYNGTFSGAGLPFVLTKMTVNADTKLLFLEQYCETTPETLVNGSGSYLIASVPSDLCELNTDVHLDFFVRTGSSTTANLKARVAGGGVGAEVNSSIINYDSANGAARMEISFSGRSDNVENPSYNQFNNLASYSFINTHAGVSSIESLNNLNIQYKSGDYEIYLDVDSMIPAGGLAIRMVKFCVGYNHGYVNIA